MPVRLDPEEKRQLQAIAERMKITVSTLIRLLVSSYVEYYEREGGRVTMPLEWSEILGEDGATSRMLWMFLKCFGEIRVMELTGNPA